jgi:hypothetical protein
MDRFEVRLAELDLEVAKVKATEANRQVTVLSNLVSQDAEDRETYRVAEYQAKLAALEVEKAEVKLDQVKELAEKYKSE